MGSGNSTLKRESAPASQRVAEVPDCRESAFPDQSHGDMRAGEISIGPNPGETSGLLPRALIIQAFRMGLEMAGSGDNPCGLQESFPTSKIGKSTIVGDQIGGILLPRSG